MVGLVIATHGNLAKELLATTEGIIGPIEKAEVVSILSKEGLSDLEGKLKEAIEKTKGPEGTLILIDIFGGTPATASLSFIDRYKIKVISGVNLPMILEVLTHREATSLEELADLALNAGQKSVLMADEIFRKKRKKKI